GVPAFLCAHELTDCDVRLWQQAAYQRGFADTGLPDQGRDRSGPEGREQLRHACAARSRARESPESRGGVAVELRSGHGLDPEVGLVDDEGRGYPGRGRRAQVAVNDEEVRQRQRREYHEQLREIGDDGLRTPAGVGTPQRVSPWQHLDDVDLL